MIIVAVGAGARRRRRRKRSTSTSIMSRLSRTASPRARIPRDCRRAVRRHARPVEWCSAPPTVARLVVGGVGPQAVDDDLGATGCAPMASIASTARAVVERHAAAGMRAPERHRANPPKSWSETVRAAGAAAGGEAAEAAGERAHVGRQARGRRLRQRGRQRTVTGLGETEAGFGRRRAVSRAAHTAPPRRGNAALRSRSGSIEAASSTASASVRRSPFATRGRPLGGGGRRVEIAVGERKRPAATIAADGPPHRRGDRPLGELVGRSPDRCRRAGRRARRVRQPNPGRRQRSRRCGWRRRSWRRHVVAADLVDLGELGQGNSSSGEPVHWNNARAARSATASS